MNPYATKEGEPIDGQFAEWVIWEQERESERRATLTPEQLEVEDTSRRELQKRMQAESEMVFIPIVKKFGVDFNSLGGALTLAKEYVTDQPHWWQKNGWKAEQTRTHELSGWTINGVIHEDYFEWVNEFTAHHSVYGRVWGDFEKEVYAESEEGFAHFYQNHPPDAWDYGDI